MIKCLLKNVNIELLILMVDPLRLVSFIIVVIKPQCLMIIFIIFVQGFSQCVTYFNILLRPSMKILLRHKLMSIRVFLKLVLHLDEHDATK